MQIYLIGIFIAFAINLIRVVFIFSDFFSTKSRNLKKIGLYFNPAVFDYTKEKPTWESILKLIANVLIIMPLLSWFSVCLSLFYYLQGIFHKAPFPEKIKEINSQISSIDLPKEKIEEYMNEMNNFYGQNYTNFDDRTAP